MEDRQSIHIRIIPYPPVILHSNWYFAERFTIEEGFSIPAGQYHRINAPAIEKISEQIEKTNNPEKREKLQDILNICLSQPTCHDAGAETANSDFIYLGPY